MDIQKPSDWGISYKDSWVSFEELKDNGAPALEGRDIVSFSSIKLAPGKPPTATTWKDINGRQVSKNPQTGKWVLDKQQGTSDKKSLRERMAAGYDRNIAKKEDRPEPPKEKNLDRPQEDITSESVKSQVKEIESKKQPKISKEQEQKEFNKKEYLKTMIEAIMADSSAGKGAGKYELSREDMETYLSYLDGNKPTIPSYDITDEDVDDVISQIKETIGKGAPYSKFISKMGRKGDPPKGMANTARARSVLKHYLETGGVSSITGQRIPFSDSQLDHRVSLDNGGVDGPDNWEWVEARFNQFKQAFSDDVVREKLKTGLAKSPLEDKRKALENEIKNLSRNSYKEHFEANGFGGVSEEDILEAKGKNGEQYLKAMAEAAGVSRYQEGAQRESGRAGGGRFIGYPALKKKLIEKIGPLKRDQIKNIDQKLLDINESISSKQKEVADISSQIRKEKAEARKKAKANLSEADYLEMLKLSRNSEFADSMVYYKGKVLGRCPKGTIKTGKTCVPGTDAQKFTKYKPGDLGGVSNKQIKKLSKAKTIDDIIKAHKEENEQND
jgi:hypothetical protein